MALDCTNLKPGDRVRLRNAEIRTVKENDGTEIPICLDDNNWYYGDGTQGYDDHPRNIAEVLPPEPPSFLPSDRPIYNTLHLKQGMLRIPSGHPMAIELNGKRYVPADSPSLYAGENFTVHMDPSGQIIKAMTIGDQHFTPADAWPDPITDRSPTKEDADPDGNVQRLDSDGDWMRVDWDCSGLCEYGWARTSDWKPKPTPAHTREEVLDILRDNAAAERNICDDLLDSIITHLEAAND